MPMLTTLEKAEALRQKRRVGPEALRALVLEGVIGKDTILETDSRRN